MHVVSVESRHIAVTCLFSFCTLSTGEVGYKSAVLATKAVTLGRRRRKREGAIYSVVYTPHGEHMARVFQPPSEETGRSVHQPSKERP